MLRVVASSSDCWEQESATLIHACAVFSGRRNRAGQSMLYPTGKSPNSQVITITTV